MARVAVPTRYDPRDLTEKDLYEFVRDGAKQFGWRIYHTLNSFGSHKGFPDVVMIRDQRIIWAELKGPNGKATPQQQEWLTELRSCDPDGRGLDVFLWYPYHMDSIPAVMLGQGPHKAGCPDDTEWVSEKATPDKQWCRTCGRWRLENTP